MIYILMLHKLKLSLAFVIIIITILIKIIIKSISVFKNYIQ